MGIFSDIFAEIASELLGEEVVTKKPDMYVMQDPFSPQREIPKASTQPSKPQREAQKPTSIREGKTHLEQHAHKHPAKTQNATTEKRPQYAGSLGALADEGCKEHADERYVQKQMPKYQASKITPSEMRKAVIMSEILGKPKSKR